jgi:hypothetical protein
MKSSSLPEVTSARPGAHQDDRNVVVMVEGGETRAPFVQAGCRRLARPQEIREASPGLSGEPLKRAVAVGNSSASARRRWRARIDSPRSALVSSG